MSQILKLSLLLCFVVASQAQSGTFRSPDGCQYPNCDFSIFWNNKGSETVFTFRAKVGAGSSYAAFALSADNKMGQDNVIVCKTTGTVEHQFNIGYFAPVLLSPTNPKIGLSDATVSNENGMITCSVTRQNSLDMPNYFELSKKYHILFATGALQ